MYYPGSTLIYGNIPRSFISPGPGVLWRSAKKIWRIDNKMICNLFFNSNTNIHTSGRALNLLSTARFGGVSRAGILRAAVVILSLGLGGGEVCGREVNCAIPIGCFDSLMLKAYWHCLKKSSSCSDFWIKSELMWCLADQYEGRGNHLDYWCRSQ